MESAPGKYPDNIRRLLIIKMSSIGDVIHALPIASLIKRNYPSLPLGWVVRERCADLLAGNPDVDKVYVLPKGDRLGDVAKTVSEIRADRYDTALDMQGLFLSGVVTALSGARRRIGLDLNRESNCLFLNEPVVQVKKKRNRHAIDILRGFLPALGIDPASEWPSLDCLAAGQAVPAEVEALRRSGKIVALNVGASTTDKQWPIDRWQALGRELLKLGYKIALVGGPQDAAKSSEIMSGIGSSDSIADIAGKTTLRQLAAALRGADLVVTCDTGPMHMASAMGTPVLGLFGPTNPTRTGPYGSRNRVIWKGIATDKDRRGALRGPEYDFMGKIEVGEVLETVLEMIGKKIA